MNLTYRQLLEWLKKFNDEQLDSNVSVHIKDADEWYPVEATAFTEEDDVLDKGHPYLETVQFPRMGKNQGHIEKLHSGAKS